MLLVRLYHSTQLAHRTEGGKRKSGRRKKWWWVKKKGMGQLTTFECIGVVGRATTSLVATSAATGEAEDSIIGAIVDKVAEVKRKGGEERSKRGVVDLTVTSLVKD